MPRRRIVRVLAALPVLALLWQSRAAEALPTDPRIVAGKLENGVTWVFRPHATPPGQLAMLLHVRSGSLNESDAQRGLAHFVEHMCFSGSEHFSPADLVKFFENTGVAFGPDVSARTDFDQTTYAVFLPNTSADEIDRGLTVLADFAFGARLAQDEVEKERGLILQELHNGHDAQQRLRDSLFPRLFAGSRFAQRLPFGQESVIAAAGQAELEGYYRTWYRPELVTVILVGDCTLDAVRPLLEKRLGRYHATVPSEPAHGPEFKPFTEPRAFVATDPEFTSGDVALIDLRPGRPPATTVEALRTELIEQLACRIVGRRLEELIQTGQASFQRAALGVWNFYHEALLVNGTASGKPEDWQKTLTALITECSRARQFGFNEREFELTREEFVGALEHAVEAEPNLAGQVVLIDLATKWNDGEPVRSARQELDLLKRLLPTIKLDELNAVFRDYFKPDTFAYVLQLPQKEGFTAPTEAQVLAAARAALEQKVEAPAVKKGPADLLTVEPTPGRAGEATVDGDLGITSVWLSNGARVHHRFMDAKKDTVLVSISLAGGQIEETAENVGVTAVAALVFDQPATSRLSSADVRDIMSGKKIGISAALGPDAFIVQITGSPEDLELGLRLAHVLLTDGKLEESAFEKWKQATLQRLAASQQRSDYRAFEVLRDFVGGGDPRLSLPTRARVDRLTAAAGQAWLARLGREAPLEVAVVGDLEWTAALPLIEKYVGSLPSRPRDASRLDPLRKIKRPPGPLNRRLEVPTLTDKAFFFYGFLGCDAVAVDDARLLQLAANMLTDRMMKELRDNRGLVYSIQAINEPSLAYEDSGLFFTYAPADPALIDDLVNGVDQVFRAFADAGPAPDEMAGAKKQIAAELEAQMKDPEYWWGILQGMDLHQVDLQKLKSIQADFGGYTAEDVRDATRKYFTPARSLRVVAVPVKPAESGVGRSPTTGPGR
jgi:zinc protease